MIIYFNLFYFFKKIKEEMKFMVENVKWVFDGKKYHLLPETLRADSIFSLNQKLMEFSTNMKKKEVLIFEKNMLEIQKLNKQFEKEIENNKIKIEELKEKKSKLEKCEGIIFPSIEKYSN